MAELSIGGVLVPALLLWGVAAFAVLQVVRRLFGLLGIYGMIWPRALFDLGLYFILLYAIVTCVSLWVGP